MTPTSAMRLRVHKRAEAIGVSAACREAGISRTLSYRCWLAFRGTDPTACTCGLGVPRLRPAPAVERRVLEVALAGATSRQWPTCSGLWGRVSRPARRCACRVAAG
jgi:hypothetical protein